MRLLDSGQNISGEENADTNAGSSKGSDMISQEIGSLLRDEMGSDAHGQATLAYQSQARDNDEDLFGDEE